MNLPFESWYEGMTITEAGARLPARAIGHLVGKQAWEHLESIAATADRQLGPPTKLAPLALDARRWRICAGMMAGQWDHLLLDEDRLIACGDDFPAMIDCLGRQLEAKGVTP